MVFGETVVYTCVEGSIVNLSVKVVEFARCTAGGVLPLFVTFFQPTVEQRQSEEDCVPCQSVIHLWPGLHTGRHTGWIKPLLFAVPGDGRVHFRASTASCELRHASAEDSQHS